VPLHASGSSPCRWSGTVTILHDSDRVAR
jgi:hypothetical protein